MNVANWANWCMIIETVGAFLLGVVSLVWRHHRKIVRLTETIQQLEHELSHAQNASHRPRHRRSTN